MSEEQIERCKNFMKMLKDHERKAEIQILNKIISNCKDYDCADNVICYIQDLLEEIQNKK